MKIVLGVIASLMIGLVTLAAMAPWGAPEDARFVMPLLPYMAAHVVLSRAPGVVFSPVLFVAGLFVDVATHGPLGFWALIYLGAALIARLLPADMMRGLVGRFGGLGAIVLALIVLQIALASLYKFEWVDWQGVIWGTSLAALPVVLVDLLWRPGRDERRVNVTDRGGGQARRAG